MNYKGSTPSYWRDYLDKGLHNSNGKVVEKTAQFIHDNVIRYSNENRTLSYEGYLELEKNWSMIESNSSHTYYQLYQARRYLAKEKARLEEKIWDNHPAFQEVTERKTGFFRRIKLSLGFT